MKPILFNTEMVRAILDGRKTVTRRVVKPQPGEEIAYIWGGSNHGKWGFSPYNKPRYEEHRASNDWKYWTPPYHADDILYVRETWKVQAAHRFESDVRIMFKAGGPLSTIQFPGKNSQATSRDDYDSFIDKWMQGDGWCPSIHMPREAARIFLRVTDVRVERLQDITVDGINSEGVDVEPPPICRKGDPTERERAAFAKLTVQKQDEYISTLARHTYMGWCKYADDLFVAWKNLWNSTIKPADRDRYGWVANPWVWVIEFGQCEKPEEG